VSYVKSEVEKLAADFDLFGFDRQLAAASIKVSWHGSFEE